MITLLRTLTMKSILKYGNKFPECSVMDLIRVGQSDYLVWSYYHCSNITFTKDVLDAIGVKDYIEKPGSDEKDLDGTSLKYISHRKRIIAEMDDTTRLRHYSHRNKVVRARIANANIHATRSEISMARRNQGH